MMVSGIVSVVQTPFDMDGEVDHASLERLVEDAVAGGVDGFLAPVVASEAAFLSTPEREAILTTICRTAAGRVPFIVGASHEEVGVCRAQARKAEALDAAAYLVAVPTPLYDAPADIPAFFEAVADGIELPLVIQDFEFNGPGMDMDTIRKLRARLPTLAGLKIETVPAGPKYSRVREAFGRDFFIAGGWAIGQFIEALDRGVDAMIPESSMVRVYKRIEADYRQGRRDAAVAGFRRLLPILAFTNQEVGVSIAFFKRLLVRKGIFRTAALRWRGLQWDRTSEAVAEALIELYLSLEAE
ncbi:MAG: dihydrodipicolinate synthase family protein [Lentisphaerae bacterium]|nr:dihydrodipicolinate synthase family protein [Lentisphaerota bacterium]